MKVNPQLETMPMKLTEEQVRQYKTHGFARVERFFSEYETAALRHEIERLHAGGGFTNVATEGDGATASAKKINLQLYGLSAVSPLFRALPFEPKIAATAERLIGGPVLFHQDQCFLKPARSGTGTHWHQDNAYGVSCTDPDGGLAMWIAVHDATLANGALQVIPGRWREKFPHSRDPDSNHHIRCYPDEREAVACEVKAGGVVVFSYGTPHCTRGNATDKARAGVALHFMREDCAPPRLRDPEQCKFPYLTGPQAGDGTREYGVAVKGTWPREVRAVLAAVIAAAAEFQTQPAG
ncbi:MAG: phytanoyl-CoA dioxygenase family protein [Planctomycetes bacterium]|nr:phytanoyl-CoA dioxygenase family protein [Planctomycetota bacterium]